MPQRIEDIEEHFTEIRFNGDCSEYRRFVQEVLAVPDAERRASLEPYYDLLRHIVEALFLESCAGTLSDEDKTRIFSVIRADWADDAPEGVRASVLSILGLIQPFEGVSDWLLWVAERQTNPDYVDALRDCAAYTRTEPIV